MRGDDRPSEGLRALGVSSLSLSVIATTASTQPNTITLRIVIALGPSGPDKGALATEYMAMYSTRSAVPHRV
jgi:hypothetical protein